MAGFKTYRQNVRIDYGSKPVPSRLRPGKTGLNFDKTIRGN